MKPRAYLSRLHVTLAVAAVLGTLAPLGHTSVELTTARTSDLAGYTTRCAGYVAIAQYEAGVTFCNRALEMYEVDWRIKLNRAAARLGFAQTAVA